MPAVAGVTDAFGMIPVTTAAGVTVAFGMMLVPSVAGVKNNGREVAVGRRPARHKGRSAVAPWQTVHRAARNTLPPHRRISKMRERTHGLLVGNAFEAAAAASKIYSEAKDAGGAKSPDEDRAAGAATPRWAVGSGARAGGS